MSSLRNFVVIVLLAGVLGIVYFAINKAPKPSDTADLGPPWAAMQGDLSKAATPTMPSSASPPQGIPALPGFPGGSALPGTSISNTSPPSVTLPAAPAVAAGGVPAPASPYPSSAPPVKSTPATAAQPTAPPPGATQPSTSALPSAPKTPAAAIGQGMPASPPAAPANPPPTGTVVLGQPPSSFQTVYPAGSAGSSPTPPAGAPTPPVQAGPSGPMAGPPAQPPVAPPPGLSEQFVTVMRAAKARLDAGQFSQAHLELSAYYASGRLGPDESRLLAELLDQLGGTVIYSRDHLLEPPYRVQPGDTLDGIAGRYNVTPELLAKINGIRDSRDLVPGQELKVVRGPFEAVVDLARYEMTVFVAGRYAGRFRIGVGRDRANLEGVFLVRDKKTRPIYYGPDRVMASEDPANPLGGRLVNLGTVTEPWGIHGTDSGKNIGTNEGRGAISLGPRDIDDVYDILSVGSRVTVRR